MITICLTHFRSLTLFNLDAALYSLRQQDFSKVAKIIVLDNNTDDPVPSIWAIINRYNFPVPALVISSKHGNPKRTHSWSTNRAVHEVQTPWIFFTRADYLLDSGILQNWVEVVEARGQQWNGFVTSNTRHLAVDIGEVEKTNWRVDSFALRRLPGMETDYGDIDSGVWLTTKAAFDAVGGLDEGLTAWGHAQTHFQWKLFHAGVETVCFAGPMVYHPLHSAPRDIELAHKQLADQGVSLREMWQRHSGRNPYA